MENNRIENEARQAMDGAVILIGDDSLGVGDKELGKILMKSFLNTLFDGEPKPAKLIFINNGIKLTTEGSEGLDAIKALEEKGVEIFSCVTCLAYYGLKDKLKVGRITKMPDTVDSLLSASKVIRI
jgi:selenium metabolism protein YedF